MNRVYRDVALLLMAAAIAALGVSLGRLNDSQGPSVQWVNIRWAPAVSLEERLRIEHEAGLYDGVHQQGQTWTYRLRDRSAANIERLLGDPRVEDTLHIDPVAKRVTLDRPELDPRLRALLETDWAGTLANALLLVAIGIAAVARRPIILLAGTALREVRRTAGEATAAIATLFDPRHESVTCSSRELAAGGFLAVLFLMPLLIYGPYEEEIVQATIMPNQVFYRALFRGQWLYWLNDLGFGSPMPVGDPLMFHPVFGPLAAFASLRVTLSAVWITHSALAAVYFLRLLAVSGVTAPLLRLLFLVLYFVSLQFAAYFYISDWIQTALTWCLYPVIVFYLRAALLGGAQAHPWRTAAGLGLLYGFWVITSHPGYIIPLTLVLTAYAIAAAPLDRRVYLCLIAGGVLCTAIAASRIYTLLSELQLFPAGGGVRDGVIPSQYVGAILAPWWAQLRNRGPFIGIGVSIALIGACVRRATFRDSHLRGSVAALAAAVVFNLIPSNSLARVLPGVSAFQFGDAIMFFSLIVAGSALQQGIGSPRPLYRYAALGVVLLQLAQQAVLAGPAFTEVTGRGNQLLFYRYQGQPAGLARVLVDTAARYGPRVYLSPSIDRAMHGHFSADGIHFSSDLVLHGLNPVQGWFKNVSMAVLYPPILLMESTIGSDVDVIRNRSLRDVLGINLILSTESETGVPPGLVVADRPRVRAPVDGLVLLANPTAWPRAVLLAPEAAALGLPHRDTCKYDTALCLDYDALARMRLDGTVALSVSEGRYVARVPPADHERLLFISGLYRPEWEATAGPARLEVRPIARAFLGVVVPPNVSDVTVAYVPRTQMAWTWFGNSVFFALVGVVVLPAVWRALRRRPAALARTV